MDPTLSMNPNIKTYKRGVSSSIQNKSIWETIGAGIPEDAEMGW